MSGYDPWAGLEYTTPYSPEQRRPTKPVGRDLTVTGLLLPYNTIINDGAHGDEVFSIGTEWEAEHWLPLTVNHSALIGMCEVVEDKVGLHVVGRIPYPCRRRATGKWWLSAKLDCIESHRRRDGVLVHARCRLVDASLCAKPVAGPTTYATFSNAAA